MTNFDNWDDIELSQNPDPRCPIILVLDSSSSMVETRPGESMSPLEALNAGLDTLVGELNKDPLAKRRVEISVVTYGSSVTPATKFATVDNLILPTLAPSGITSTGAAVVEALNALEERKKTYKKNGISLFRPWIVLISDGLATDDTSEAIRRIREAEEKKSVAFFAIGVDGADMSSLNKFSNRGAVKLKGVQFDSMFQWLSASQSAVSASNPGEEVDLPVPSGWLTV